MADTHLENTTGLAHHGDDHHVCPECGAGKHRNCDGTAWCFTYDRQSDCVCNHEAVS